MLKILKMFLTYIGTGKKKNQKDLNLHYSP